MFADPLSLVAVVPTALVRATLSGTGGSALSFVCTGRGPVSSTYRYSISSSHYVDLLISRQVGKRSRYTARFTETELVSDPINSELNAQKTATVYIVADVGVLGETTNFIKMCTMLASEFLLKVTDESEGLIGDMIDGQT